MGVPYERSIKNYRNQKLYITQGHNGHAMLNSRNSMSTGRVFDGEGGLGGGAGSDSLAKHHFLKTMQKEPIERSGPRLKEQPNHS